MSKEEDQYIKFLELEERVRLMEVATEKILAKIRNAQNKTTVLVGNKRHESYSS